MILTLILFTLFLTSSPHSYPREPMKKEESRACIKLKGEKACWIARVSRTSYTRRGKESLFVFEISFVQKDRNVLLENHSCELTLSLLRDTFSCRSKLNYSSSKTSFTVEVDLRKNGKQTSLTLYPEGKVLEVCSPKVSRAVQRIRIGKGEWITVGFEAVRGRIRALINDGRRTSTGKWLNLKDILNC